MKYLLAGLFIGCLMSPAWSQGREMTLEEFVQKLGKAKPWTSEKVETELGIKFSDVLSTGVIRDYAAYEPLPSVQDLIIQYIEVTFRENDNKPLYMRIEIDSRLNCLELERVKKLYPNGNVDAKYMGLGGGYLYTIEPSWGSVTFDFSFGAYRSGEKCLERISVSDTTAEKE